MFVMYVSVFDNGFAGIGIGEKIQVFGMGSFRS